ncbi:Acid phosphatase-like protein 2, partial [Entomortierella beljakovae]
MWKGDCAPGQLTSFGAQQLQQLGENLREIYVDRLKLLPAIFDPSTIYLRSTDKRRTRQSAENLMVGMYGSDDETMEDTSLQLQIQVLPSKYDYMTMNTKRCPRISQLRSEIGENSDVIRILEESQSDYRDEVNSILGTWDLDFIHLVDTIFPRICHQLPLQCEPGNQERCITFEMADRCLSYASKEVAEAQYNVKGVQEMLQLGIGPLTRDILNNIMDAKENKTVPFSLFSGHDTTLSPLLGMLESSDMRWPPY